MKERPILFSTPMVQAILEGRKTMTRRVVKGLPKGTHEVWFDGGEWIVENELGQCWVNGKLKCPYGQRGDRLWVRETYLANTENDSRPYTYKADWHDSILNHPKNKGIWLSPLFMPKAAARLWLEITNIRVERLRDISEEDAQKEGVTMSGCQINSADGSYLFSYLFFALWSKINGEESLKQNPWVWVIEFRRIEK
jgi:hypothetical protein